MEDGGASWSWPDGLTAAVSLSYDGTQLCHLETVAPQLDRYGFQGTFYARPEVLLEDAVAWRSVQSHGHELGNGCLLGSACEDGSLPRWTLEMISAEISDTEDLLTELTRSPRGHSFAYPCGTPRCARGDDYRDLVETFSHVARSGVDGLNAGQSCDMKYLRRVHCADFTADEMIDMVELAIKRRAWLIFEFGGVGVGDQAIDAKDHVALCEYLESKRSQLWIDSVVSIASRLRVYRQHTLHLV